MKPYTLLPHDVAAFLRANPGWLTENPELYRVLDPPVRTHGETLTDHMAAMIAQERAHARAQSSLADSVLAAGRAAAGLASRVEDAVLALMRNADPVDCLASELPALLGVDAVTLCAAQGWRGARKVPAGLVATLFGGREVVFRDAPADARILYGEAAPLARVDALVRLGDGALLALASRERLRLHPEQGTRPLVFLGRAVAAAFAR